MAARVFSYQRVSSGKQAHGAGMDRQAEGAAAWCQQRGLTLDDTLHLADEGRSAFKGEHLAGALGRFLKLAQAGDLGEAPVLLVEAFDRLSRLEPLDGLHDVALALIRAGVRVVTLEDGAEYSRDTLRNDASKLLVLTVKTQAAWEYSQRLSRRIEDSWNREREKLRSGQLTRPGAFLPRWCDMVDGRPKLNAYADVARQALLLLRDHGENATARILNQQGAESPGGKEWTRGAVTSLLRDERTWGAVTLHSPHSSRKRTAKLRARGLQPEVIAGLLPPLLPREDIEGIRALVRNRAGHTAVRGPNNQILWIAQGATICTCGATCGTRVRSSRKGEPYRYIRCRHGLSHADGCRGRSYPIGDLTAHVLTRLRSGQIRQLLADDDGRDLRAAADRAELQRLTISLARAEDAERNAAQMLKAALKAGSDDPLHLEAVQEARAEVAQLREQIATTRARLVATTNDDTERVETAAVELLQTFARGEDTPDQRRVVNVALKRLGVTVVLDADRPRVGLKVGDGEVDWQVFMGAMAQTMLERGLADAVYEERTDAGAEWVEVAAEALRSGGLATLVLPDGTEIRFTPEQFRSLTR
jgi:DNA invertase Pin-like site-specific DNA recombinase